MLVCAQAGQHGADVGGLAALTLRDDRAIAQGLVVPVLEDQQSVVRLSDAGEVEERNADRAGLDRGDAERLARNAGGIGTGGVRVFRQKLENARLLLLA